MKEYYKKSHEDWVNKRNGLANRILQKLNEYYALDDNDIVQDISFRDYLLKYTSDGRQFYIGRRDPMNVFVLGAMSDKEYSELIDYLKRDVITSVKRSRNFNGFVTIVVPSIKKFIKQARQSNFLDDFVTFEDSEIRYYGSGTFDDNIKEGCYLIICEPYDETFIKNYFKKYHIKRKFLAEVIITDGIDANEYEKLEQMYHEQIANKKQQYGKDKQGIGEPEESPYANSTGGALAYIMKNPKYYKI